MAMQNQDETKPIKIPYPVGKKPKGLYFTIAILALVIVVLGFFLVQTAVHQPKQEEPPLTLEMAQQKVQEIDQLESDIREKRMEISSLLENYKEKDESEIPAINMLDLTEEERQILRQTMNEEGDVSIKSLLADILEKNTTIRQLTGRIQEIEELLPQPHIVARGETHFAIAWNFLVKEKKLPPDKAKAIIEKISLFDTLVPGFKVWNFYSGREYGTFVTQGKAKISPYEAKQRVKKKLLASRDRAIKEYQRQKNSLYYLLDSERNLKKKGLLKSGFLKAPTLKDISPEHFKKAIDLRKKNTIAISVARVKLKKIKKILVYPRFYKEGRDYKVTVAADKMSAVLTILDKEKLKNERVVISVE
jgi:hypothetical protein